MTVLIAGLVDGAIVLALTLAAVATARRRSAALRHAILATGIAAALAMPVFELVLPQLPVIKRAVPAVIVTSEATLQSDVAIEAPSLGEGTAIQQAGAHWPSVLAMVWAVGALVIAAGLITGFVRLARLRARSMPADGPWRSLTNEISRECGIKREIAVLRSDHPSLLVTCGLLRPAIVLPAGAASWPEDRVRNVLRHELAHIKRHDAAIQTAAEVFRMLHWINPLAWLACARLRQESEYACDDAVLSGGVRAADYAADLLDVAMQLSARHARWASAPAIAHPSTLERRVVAMLHRDRNRVPVGRRGWIAVVLVALAISMPLAAAGIAPAEQAEIARADGLDLILLRESDAESAPASARDTAAVPPSAPETRRTPARRQEISSASSQATAAVTGLVLDQSGGVIPGAQAVLTDTQSGKELTVMTDSLGRFAFRGLPPSRYQLVVHLAGFATIRPLVGLGPGDTSELTIRMPLGTLQERVSLYCAAAPETTRPSGFGVSWRPLRDALLPVLYAQGPQRPVRVGGDVRAPRKLRDVKPICPSDVPAGETRVRLNGRVNADGVIQGLEPEPPAIGEAPLPSALVQAARDAVRQWTYTPAHLNGVPVTVDIQVEIVFRKR